MKALFDKEREAVAAGKDRQPFIAESEGLTAEARKRGPRKPSDASMAYAAAVRAPSVRRPRDRNRNRDVKKTGMTGLPGVVAAHEVSGRARLPFMPGVADCYYYYYYCCSS